MTKASELYIPGIYPGVFIQEFYLTIKIKLCLKKEKYSELFGLLEPIQF